MKAVKNVLVGFIVSFLGSLPLGYLNIIGVEILSELGIKSLVFYLFGVIFIEAIIIYFTVIFANQLAENKKLMKFIDFFAVFFLLLIAYLFYANSNQTAQDYNYLEDYIQYSPFLIGMVLCGLNFLQIPFWLGWNLYLLNANYIVLSQRLKFHYILGTLVGTFFGMLAVIVLLNSLSQKTLEYSKWIMPIIIPLFFIVLAVLALFVGYRNFKHQQKNALLQQQSELKDEQQRLELAALKAKFDAVDAERNRIAADLHDEIGAALSSIHIYSNVAKKKVKAHQDASGLIEKIDSASAGLLDRMSDIIWSINPEHQTLLDLKLRIKSFAADLLFPLGMNISYTTEDVDDDLKLSAIARKNIYLCFKELINNIAKHSRATEVRLTLICHEGILQCAIADNGIGFNPLLKGNGNGLHNVQRRIKQLGGEFFYNSEPGKGVVLNFSLGLTNISD